MAEQKPQLGPAIPGFQRPASGQQSPETVPLPSGRADVQISPQLYLGKTVYVVKDPVSLGYYRLQPAEHFVFVKLDGRLTAQQMAEMVNARFPDQQTTPAEVVTFVRMLQGNGLLVGRGDSHGRYLRTIRDNRQKRKRRAAVLGFMFFKLSLLDPDRMLDAMHGFLRPFLTRFWLWVAMLFMLVSAGAVALEVHRIGTLAFPVLGWQNLLMLSATFFGVKVVHELGHGLAAKRSGMEVHEMGVMLMVFLPMYYVDITDAWMAPRKRDRLWINGGGVFAEFLFASIAAWVWIATEPGIVNQVAFNVMLAASLTTLIFNANPLLRYDGYYFLMDWLEIPNLRAKAQQYLAYLAKRYVLGMGGVFPPPEAARKPIFMPLYAVASSAYRVLIVFGLITLIWHILDPYGLEAIGSLLGMFAIATMVLWPMVKLVRFVVTQQAKTWRRAAMTLGGAAGLAAIAWGILAIPIERSIEHPAVTLAPERRPLYVPVSGRVAEVYVKGGATLGAGDPVLRLANDDLDDRLKMAKVKRELVAGQRRVAQSQGAPNRLLQLVSELEKIDEEITHLAQKIDELTVRAPIAGRLAAAQNLRRMIGAHLKQGDELGMMVSPGTRTVALVVPQADASTIGSGMEARVRLWGRPDPVHVGKVRRVGTQFLEHLPHEALSGRYGGEVDIQPGGEYKSTPSARSVLAEIVLEGEPPSLADGMTGRGKVVIGHDTLGSIQWRTIRRAMSLDWWL